MTGMSWKADINFKTHSADDLDGSGLEIAFKAITSGLVGSYESDWGFPVAL